MKQNLHFQEEWILSAAAFAFVVIIGFFLVWGVDFLAVNLGSSLDNSLVSGGRSGFQLEQGKKLDLRGLAQ